MSGPTLFRNRERRCADEAGISLRGDDKGRGAVRWRDFRAAEGEGAENVDGSDLAPRTNPSCLEEEAMTGLVDVMR